MWNSRSVRLDVSLPADVADEVESTQHSDPEFVARVFQYGFTRRSAYREMQQSDGGSEAGSSALFRTDPAGVRP